MLTNDDVVDLVCRWNPVPDDDDLSAPRLTAAELLLRNGDMPGVAIAERRTRPTSASTSRWRGPLVAAGTAIAVLIVVGIAVLAVRGEGSGVADETEPIVETTEMAPTTVAEGQSAILATTKAKPLPAQATCPPGSDSDASDPVDQARPANFDGAQAFDRHAGRIIVLANDEQPRPRTWTFDVCSNTWQRMGPTQEPGWDDPVTLVYDADSDRTIAFTRDRVWSYDFSADRWTMKGGLPRPMNFIVGWGEGDRPAAVYHHPSGLVLVYDRDSMWAYDVEIDTWTEVRQTPDPTRPSGSGMPKGVTTVAYDRDRNLLLAAIAVPDGFFDDTGLRSESQYRSWLADAVLEIWAFDPATGSWRFEPSQVPAGVLWSRDGWFYGPVSRAAFDETIGATVLLSPDGWVEAYDGQKSWRADVPGDGRHATCDSVDPVYDPLHGRIVCQVAGGGVSSFATATGQWTWLLKPDERAS